MIVDTAKDVKRLTSVTCYCLAGMTIARRDLVIDRLRHGEFAESSSFKKESIPHTYEEDFICLRIAPLYGRELFSSRHLQDFLLALC